MRNKKLLFCIVDEEDTLSVYSPDDDESYEDFY